METISPTLVNLGAGGLLAYLIIKAVLDFQLKIKQQSGWSRVADGMAQAVHLLEKIESKL